MFPLRDAIHACKVQSNIDDYGSNSKRSQSNPANCLSRHGLEDVTSGVLSLRLRPATGVLGVTSSFVDVACSRASRFCRLASIAATRFVLESCPSHTVSSALAYAPSRNNSYCLSSILNEVQRAWSDSQAGNLCPEQCSDLLL